MTGNSTAATSRADLALDCPLWPAEVAERYRALGYWQGTTFGDLLAERASQFGERTAVVDATTRVTYAELDSAANQIAAGLHRMGVRARDRVVLHLPNTTTFFEVLFGLFRLGALPVLALPAHRRAEISYFCAHTDARAYITTAEHRDLAADLTTARPGLRVVVDGDPGPFTALGEVRDAAAADLPPGPDAGDIAFLQLSGGSTGLPKLIPRTHDDYLYSVRASAEICGLDRDSVYLAALPVAHNFPLSSPGALGVLHAGGRLVLAPDPSPDTALSLVARERVTITAVVPPLAAVWAASAQRHDLSSLRLLQVGGATFSPTAAERVLAAFDCRLQQVFGMAEGLVSYTRLDDDRELVVGTQGRPISPDDEIRVVDDADRDVDPGVAGHLLTRGPYTIRGYYRAAEHNARAFTEDGFYRTGDIVRRTPTGHLVVVGRDKDQINRGGEKIAVDEVEDHLLAHPGVHDAVVVAVPDAFLGERACAVIVPAAGALTTREVADFLRGRGLAAFKIPDLVRMVDGFPHTAVGKVGRREIRRAITDEARSVRKGANHQ